MGMVYFNNRILSSRFNINLSRWKRWCREFLPPDPLGGMQSGYARQLTRDDAFTVYLGGHLVRDLRFSIPDAKQILADLHDWLAASGFYQIARRTPEDAAPVDRPVSAYQIYITAGPERRMRYMVRGLLSETVTPIARGTIRENRYWEYVLGCGHASPHSLSPETIYLVNITAVHRRFLKLLAADD